MADDRELTQDILRAAAKLLAHESVRQRYDFDSQYFYSSTDQSVAYLNSSVRCLILAERYERGEKPVL